AAAALTTRPGPASGGDPARLAPLAPPLSEVKPLPALVGLDLEAHPPPAPVTRVAVSAHPIRAQVGQGGLWQPPVPAIRDLVSVLARLAALVGVDSLGSPALLDSHRPDAFAMLAFSPPIESDAPARGDATEPRLALRRMR